MRYGVGPLLTPGSRLVAKMIKLQDEMELPIGLVLKESGYKTSGYAPDRSECVASPERIATYTLPRLLEKRLRNRLKAETITHVTIQADPEIQVY